MAFEEICPPALIYLIFSTTQVVIDTVKGYYNLALTKLLVALIFTILLNYLCSLGLGIISWLIVFIPFILMTLIVSMLLLMFGLEKVYNSNNPFDWMEMISIQGKTNFFEKRVGEYSNNANPKSNSEDNIFELDDNF